MLMRLALAALALAGSLVLARADGLAPAGTAAQGQCYASGTSGPRVPCVLQGQTWTRVLRPTDPASDMPVAVPGAPLARTAAQRAAEVVNVADYATCDGATDVVAGVRAAAAKAGPQKALYFPPMPGACMMSDSFTVASGTTIYAQPGTVTLKVAPGNTGGLFYVSNAGKVTVRGLGFDGGGQDFPSSGNLLVAFQSTEIAFDNIAVANTRGVAVVFSSVSKSGVKNSSFKNIGNHWRTTLSPSDRQQAVTFCCGITSQNISNFVIDNYFEDIGLDAISMGNATGATIIGNRCELTNDQIAKVSHSEYAACVYTTDADGVTITSNYSRGATGNSFDIHNTKNYAISGNVLKNSGAAGIGVFSSAGSVTGNTVINAAMWPGSPFKGAISYSGDLTGVTATGNTLIDDQATPTTQYAFHLYSGSLTNSRIDQSNTVSGIAARVSAALSSYTVARAVTGISAPLVNIPTITDYGAAIGGDWTAAFQAAEASAAPIITLPAGKRYPTTLGHYQAVTKKYVGPGVMVSGANNDGTGGAAEAQHRSFITSQVAPPPNVAVSPFQGIFDFDQTKAATTAYTYVGAGATPPATTSYTPMPQLAQTVRSYEFDGAGFQANPDNHTGGRSGAAMDFLRLNHGGQGDAGVMNLLLQAYGNRAGATHFLAQPAIGLAYGDIVASTGSGDGKYLQGLELNFRDNGTAAAAGGLTFNYHRTNAGTGLHQVWVHDRPQSVGTVPIDAFYAPFGAAKRGLDTTGSTLTDALVMRSGQCIRFGATATADSANLTTGATDLGASKACLDASGYLHIDAGAGKGVILDNLPTVASGLPSGALYKDASNFLKVAP